MFGASGPYSGAPRILDVLSGHGVRATFFTPAWVVRTWPDLCRRIVAEGHELAGHGDLHETFFALEPKKQTEVLERSQQTFSDVVGAPASGFRAPSGDLTTDTLTRVAAAGYTYSSSMRDGDRPYRHRSAALTEIPVKSLFDDYSAFAYHRAPHFPEGLDRVAPYAPVFRSWMEEIDAAAEEGLTVPTIWHPEVIGTPGRVILMDDFIGELASRADVRIHTCEQIASEFEAGVLDGMA